MKRFKAWLLRRLIRERIFFGSHYEAEIDYIYHEVWVACSEEFSEDSPSSLKAYLQERFDNACEDDPVG